MTKKKTTKRALVMSILSLVVCVSMFVGTTFAWFTDSVTSTGNIIKSGSLDVEMLWSDDNANWNDASKGAIFDYPYWEPGYTEIKYIKIRNVGDLAFKFQLNIIPAVMPAAGEYNLADVIDVYMLPAEEVTRADIDAATPVGTLAQLMADADGAAYGYLLPNEGSDRYNGLEAPRGEIAYCIALKMQESAGNDYQNLSVGDGFSVQLLATQYTWEKDSFDDQYDAGADLDWTPVSNVNELKIALANKEANIVLTKDIETSETFNVDYAPNINGAGKTISRAAGFTGDVFAVKANAALELANIVVDGGAVWAADGTNSGVTVTGNLIAAEANAQIILNEGAVLQNNDGAHAVDLGTRIGATLTMNGGEISYNRSDSGAVWGGGHITINEGSKINNNRSTGSAGAIRMVGNCNLTMNGGEICNNTAAADGGAIWGYGVNGNTSIYNLNGGKISNNTAGGVGGGIYTGTYSTVNLSGDFEICGNTAAESGALRLTNYTIFNMTGGKISGNVSTNNAAQNGFYGWCPRLTITGGELADNIYLAGGHTPTVGGDGITGVVNFNIGTNHNTINLAPEFGTIKFVAVEDTNFSAFNFKPADGYTYTEGDEAKLICMNEGYETYWDAATGTFRLQAK